jgi:hypothetical protein
VQAFNKVLPLFQGLLPLKREQVVPDILAGVTLAALALPEVLGYTKIAGVPVITGIYTMLLPMLLYGIFGASRHLVVVYHFVSPSISAINLDFQSISATKIRESTKAWHGVRLNQPDWSNCSHSVAVSAEFVKEGNLVHWILNAYWEPLDFELPASGGGDDGSSPA